MNILIIGGTGFIGQRLVRKLHAEGQKIFLLVRGESQDKARRIFADLEGVTFLRGDIENTDILADVGQVTKVNEQIECVVHMAANYKLGISPKDAYLQNVVGSQNVLKYLPRIKNLKYFHYFSTYAVNQVLEGKFSENDLIDENSPFFDQYAKSKNNAEHLVRKLAPKNIKTIIHRPGIIVGDSQTGERDKEDGPYYFFDFIHSTKKFSKITERLKLLPLPVTPNSVIPVLPVDTLIEWSSKIILNPKDRQLSCYHLVPKTKIKTKEFLQHSIELLNSPLKIVSFPLVQIFPPAFKLLNLPEQLVFYMKYQGELERKQLEQDYPDLVEPDYKSYLPVLLKGYLKDEV